MRKSIYSTLGLIAVAGDVIANSTLRQFTCQEKLYSIDDLTIGDGPLADDLFKSDPAIFMGDPDSIIDELALSGEAYTELQKNGVIYILLATPAAKNGHGDVVDSKNATGVLAIMSFLTAVGHGLVKDDGAGPKDLVIGWDNGAGVVAALQGVDSARIGQSFANGDIFSSMKPDGPGTTIADGKAATEQRPGDG